MDSIMRLLLVCSVMCMTFVGQVSCLGNRALWLLWPPMQAAVPHVSECNFCDSCIADAASGAAGAALELRPEAYRPDHNDKVRGTQSLC